MTIKVNGDPVQPLAVGVTVIVLVTGLFVIFVAVNCGMLPVPLATRPIAGLLFVQEKVVPATGPEIIMADV